MSQINKTTQAVRLVDLMGPDWEGEVVHTKGLSALIDLNREPAEKGSINVKKPINK